MYKMYNKGNGAYLNFFECVTITYDLYIKNLIGIWYDYKDIDALIFFIEYSSIIYSLSIFFNMILMNKIYSCFIY